MLPVELEIDPTKSFHEDVSMLLCRLDVLYGNFPGPKKIANEVETHIYLFTSGRDQRIFDQLFPPLVVLKDLMLALIVSGAVNDKTARTNKASLIPSPAMYSASEVGSETTR